MKLWLLETDFGFMKQMNNRENHGSKFKSVLEHISQGIT